LQPGLFSGNSTAKYVIAVNNTKYCTAVNNNTPGSLRKEEKLQESESF